LHTKRCVNVLAGIVGQKAAPTASRVAAAVALLDRGWGKAVQPATVGGQASIKVVIRHILEGADGEAIDAEPTLLEGKAIDGGSDT
jgi:aspartate aminotransferase-like enzyme